MGNIVRQVTGPDGTTVAASQELERVVPEFFGARGESPKATAVWALVMSKEIQAHVLSITGSMLGRSPDSDSVEAIGAGKQQWEKLWARKPPVWNDLVSEAIAAGARLHRVLSGGGGWGKKAGLLSLDPVANTPETPTEDVMADDPSDLSSALPSVVRNGEFIQFFASPPETASQPWSDAVKLKRMSRWRKRWHWELGTIPSTADALTAGSWQHDSAASKETYVFRGSFGALTEDGITMNGHFRSPGEEPSKVRKSKVDVPFSRFSMVQVEDQPGNVGGLNDS